MAMESLCRRAIELRGAAVVTGLIDWLVALADRSPTFFSSLVKSLMALRTRWSEPSGASRPSLQ